MIVRASNDVIKLNADLSIASVNDVPNALTNGKFFGHDVVAVNGVFYIYGLSMSSNAASADLITFDPAAQTFKVLAPSDGLLPSARTFVTLFYENNMLYVFGGSSSLSSTVPLSDLWTFNIADRKWSLANAEGSRTGMIAPVFARDSQNGYFYGGKTQDGVSEGIKAYNYEQNSFINVNNDAIKSSRYFSCGAASVKADQGMTWYIFGGKDPNTNEPTNTFKKVSHTGQELLDFVKSIKEGTDQPSSPMGAVPDFLWGILIVLICCLVCVMACLVVIILRRYRMILERKKRRELRKKQAEQKKQNKSMENLSKKPRKTNDLGSSGNLGPVRDEAKTSPSRSLPPPTPDSDALFGVGNTVIIQESDPVMPSTYHQPLPPEVFNSIRLEEEPDEEEELPSLMDDIIAVANNIAKAGRRISRVVKMRQPVPIGDVAILSSSSSLPRESDTGLVVPSSSSKSRSSKHRPDQIRGEERGKHGRSRSSSHKSEHRSERSDSQRKHRKKTDDERRMHKNHSSQEIHRPSRPESPKLPVRSSHSQLNDKPKLKLSQSHLVAGSSSDMTMVQTAHLISE